MIKQKQLEIINKKLSNPNKKRKKKKSKNSLTKL